VLLSADSAIFQLNHGENKFIFIEMMMRSALHLDQAKDYTIGICCFSAKHASLRRKSEDWLARNQDNVFEWGDMSIRWLLFHYKNPTQRVGLMRLVQSGLEPTIYRTRTDAVNILSEIGI
jgi:hypothetical protein